ncbi:MAG: hypothetical protein QF605_03760, partial [Rhodospirillales bacterium]|nr:hypothetical protein [Rhodospirillales bacterium]
QCIGYSTFSFSIDAPNGTFKSNFSNLEKQGATKSPLINLGEWSSVAQVGGNYTFSDTASTFK